MAIDFFTQIVGEGAVLEVGDAELGGDGEPRWYGEAQVRHFGETGSLAAQDVAHGGRAVGPAVAEGIHPPLERPHGGSAAPAPGWSGRGRSSRPRPRPSFPAALRGPD